MTHSTQSSLFPFSSDLLLMMACPPTPKQMEGLLEVSLGLHYPSIQRTGAFFVLLANFFPLPGTDFRFFLKKRDRREKASQPISQVLNYLFFF